MYQSACRKRPSEDSGSRETVNAYLVHLTLQDFTHSVGITDADLIVRDADKFAWLSMLVFLRRMHRKT